MTIGEKIRTLRKKAGYTQKELGEISGTSETTIKQYEIGKRLPRIDQLQKIASVLNVPVASFIDELPEAQRIKSTWNWIQDNDEKRKELIIEMLKTHNYQVTEKDIHWLIITDYQGFSFHVEKEEFQEMVQRCDKDIRYNIEKLLSDSRRFN
jgi:transcriptional regulator with XRE-family HTH domain